MCYISVRHVSLLSTAFLVSTVVGVPAVARTQSQDASQQSSSQDSSVANAARRSREKKKDAANANAAKPAKVITDEDLDKKNFQPGQEGLNVGASPMAETAPPSANAVAAEEAADDSARKEEAKDAAEQGAKIAKLKLEITEAENGLDFAQRQLALDQDSYFSKTDYARDTAGKAKIDGEKQDVSDRQQQIEKLKARLAVEESKSQSKGNRAQPAPPQNENPPAAPPQR